MTNKQSIYSVLFMMLAAAIVAKVRAVYEKHVPMGYQDETGFHMGNGSDSDDLNFPTH